VHAVAVSADGTTVVSGGGGGTVRVWDLITGREQAKLTGHDEWVWAVALSTDGTGGLGKLTGFGLWFPGWLR
jgi:WD40 repeat protein